MEFQLVIEFSGDGSQNFQKVVDLELMLEEQLNSGEVDGNDVGLGVANIFIITKDPEKCFAEAMRLIAASLTPSAAGYRPLEGEDYVRLWPSEDRTPFELR
jgi:hypothetical protein